MRCRSRSSSTFGSRCRGLRDVNPAAELVSVHVSPQLDQASVRNDELHRGDRTGENSLVITRTVGTVAHAPAIEMCGIEAIFANAKPARCNSPEVRVRTCRCSASPK